MVEMAISFLYAEKCPKLLVANMHRTMANKLIREKNRKGKYTTTLLAYGRGEMDERTARRRR